MFIFEVRQIVLQGLLRQFSHVDVKRSENTQPLTGQHRWRITLRQLLLDVISKVRSVVGFGFGMLLACAEWLGYSELVCGLADVAIPEHCGQYFIAAHHGVLGVPQGIEAVGGADHSRNRRHLANGQIARLPRKIGLRRLPNTAYPLLSVLSEVDVVQIQFENFIFRIALLSNIGHQGLGDFPMPVAFAAEKEILH
jgi:hypothetical protein